MQWFQEDAPQHMVQLWVLRLSDELHAFWTLHPGLCGNALHPRIGTRIHIDAFDGIIVINPGSGASDLHVAGEQQPAPSRPPSP